MIQLGNINDIVAVMGLIITDMLPLIVFVLGILIGLIIFDVISRVIIKKRHQDHNYKDNDDDDDDDDDYY